MSNYVTKNHPAIHHEATRSTYLTYISKLIELRKRQKGYVLTFTSCSKSVLDRSGLYNTAGDFKKTLEDRKFLNMIHNNRQERAKVHLFSETLRQRALLAMSA